MKTSFKWIDLLLLLLFKCGYIYSQSTASVRGNADGKCMTNLMNELANDAFSSSSFQENFYPYEARITFDKPNHTSSSGSAWCPRGEVGSDSSEFIQVTFDSLKMLSNILLLGRDYGNFGFYVPFFYLDYRRESDSSWHRYRGRDENTLITGNTDSRNTEIRPFHSNVVAKTIRIIPISTSSKTKVCLKFTLYGCDFNDNVVEYSIPNGNTFIDPEGQKYFLLDRAYDSLASNESSKPGALLYGGIGQLMDNQINSESLQSTKNDVFNFVGWRRSSTMNALQMTFKLDKVRKIKSIRFHILNNFVQNISIFSSVKCEFSIGGEIYGVRAPDITYNHTVDTYVMNVRWVKIALNNSSAKYLRLSLTFRLDWMIMTEIIIETSPQDVIVPVEPMDSVVVTKSTVTRDVKGDNSTMPMGFLLIMLGGIFAFLVALIVVVFFIIRLRRHRKRRFKGKTNPSILYGNMPCNNVIPIPVITNSNGGFYKPIPSGVYDCMLPYQSQTLNVRKVTSFPSQHSQQQFGTFNNRGNGSVNTMMKGMNKDNFNATLSPIAGQQCFNQNINTLFSENKRASFDGSYAGTGSNPDYSNPSLIRESLSAENTYLPVHLMNMSPVMYGQFQTQDNDHQLGQFQVRIPYNVLYPTENHIPDPSLMVWSDELSGIMDMHSRPDILLQSPVGGSIIVNQNNVGNQTTSVVDFEMDIIHQLVPIEISQIDIHSMIGSGKYGTVYKGLYNGSTVVVKSIDRNCPPLARVIFLKSVSGLLSLKNANVARIIGYCTYSSSDLPTDLSNQIFSATVNCIVMEHSRYTDLHTFIRMFTRVATNIHSNSLIQNKTGSDTSSTSVEDEVDDPSNKSFLSHSCLIFIASQISNGMSFLEQEGLVHRDLATRNCLLGPRLSIIITDTAMNTVQFQEDYIAVNDVVSNLVDMGLVCPTGTLYPRVNLPLYWMSWEAALKAEYSIKSDIWSFGVILWEILTNCQSKPYFSVPQHPSNLGSMNPINCQCLSLLYNFKCLAQCSDNALLPNNETLNQIRKVPSSMNPLPLPIPSLLIDERRSMTTPITPNVKGSFRSMNNHILNTSREMRDLMESCWSIDPSMRPNFRDISRFLGQKINGFNAEEEYQMLPVGITKRTEEAASFR